VTTAGAGPCGAIAVESAPVSETSPSPAAAYRTIRELSGDERPRERLLRHGPAVLGDAELIAIVLGSGLRGVNVLDLARGLIERAGGLAGLRRADPAALQRTPGLGPAKAAQLAAALELGRRAQQLDPDSRPLLLTPEAVNALMAARLLGRPKEELHVLSLDTKGRLLGSPAVVPGGVNSVQVRAAEVFREPVVLHATSVVLVHNHPSGDPAPSRPDAAITKSLIGAGELLDIEVLDHVIVGDGRFVSMRREGYWAKGGKAP
jgi:DNA repair protein RadC